MKKFLPILTVILLGLLFSSRSVYSSAPDFTSATIVNQGGNYVFHLVWQNTDLLTTEFRIYVANANVTSTSDPAFHLSTTYPGTIGDSNLRSYTTDINFTGYGDFSIYIAGVVGGIEYPSLIKHLNFPQPPVITFTTSPVTSGLVGQVYTYSANATATPAATLTYELVYGPPLMTINASSGVVTWTNPTTKGTYSVTIKAVLASDPLIYVLQSWTLYIAQCSTFGFISGTVKDEAGNIITSGTIDVYAEVTDSILTHYVFFTTTNIASDGSYSHDFDGGNYKLYIHGSTFDSEWYQDQTTIDAATVVAVTCGNTSTANINVHLTAPHYTVSGKVTKSDGTTPIERARVHFYGLLPGQTIISFNNVTTTDASGNYSMSLSNVYNYEVMAEGPSTDSVTTPVYYQSQFWNNAANPNDATLLTLTANLSNINFSLGDVVNVANKLFGQVNGLTAGNRIPSWVIIFYVQGTGAALYSLQTYDATGTNGKFEFNGLADGNYVIQSIPVDDTYVYGYHCTDAPGTVVSDWTTATQITIAGANPSGSHEVLHPQVATGTGVGVFSGFVGHGILGMTMNTSKSNKMQASSPLPGAMVYVLTQDKHKIIRVAPSDHKGNFNITGLPLQSYDVIVDKVGFQKVISSIQLDNQNTTVNKSLDLPPYINDVDEENLPQYFALYPNPSVDNINIDFYTKDNSVNIIIANTLGSIVYSSVYSTIPGHNTLNLDIKQLASGLYLIKIMEKGKYQSIPLIINR